MLQVIQTTQDTKAGAPASFCEAMLNTFYAHFDLLNKDSAVKSTLSPDDHQLSVTTADVRKIILRLNMSKAARTDNIPCHVLKHVLIS